jgi:hypothetical protein
MARMQSLENIFLNSMYPVKSRDAFGYFQSLSKDLVNCAFDTSVIGGGLNGTNQSNIGNNCYHRHIAPNLCSFAQ